MTLNEIAKRLGEEFPNRSVCFDVDVWHHGCAGPRVDVRMYDTGLGKFFHCTSLDDGIAKLRAAIPSPPPPPPGDAIGITFGGEPCD